MKSVQQSKRCLLVCCDLYGTLGGIVLMLQRAGMEVHAAMPETHFSYWPLSGLSKHSLGADDGASFVDRLRLLLEQEAFDQVILHDDEAIRRVCSRLTEPWAREIYPLNPDRVDPRLACSKVAFSQFCGPLGLPLPEWRIVRTRNELDDAAAQIGLPVIVKPDDECAGQGIVIVRHPRDLETAWQRACKRGAAVVQRFIPGRVGSVHTLYRQGALLGFISSYKLRVFPEPFGPSSSREVAGHPETEEILVRFGNASGFNGMLGFDWIEDPETKKIYLLELNARPAGPFRFGPQAGVPFGSLLAGGVKVADTPPMRPVWRVGSKIHQFPQALLRALVLKSPSELFEVLGSISFWKDLPWDSPSLVFAHVRGTIQRLSKHWGGAMRRRLG
jgi:predicted ATP-grasp superfamily ATP-dependent carboligase